VFGALYADGSFGYVWTTAILSGFILGIMVWDGGLRSSGI
jgi:hypothetical protein